MTDWYNKELANLFQQVQTQGVFPDGKTFVDCVPKFPMQEISEKYLQQKEKDNFDLKEFVTANFELPTIYGNGYITDRKKSVDKHIEELWEVLTRKPHNKKKDSSIPLPHPYIVPGGRFGEIYYWDSYFTMLGLQASGKAGMIENMVKNFSHLIDTVGYIPNGNRTYYLGRSQPPFFSLMIRLLSEEKASLPDRQGKDILVNYLPQLEQEYNFWMKGVSEVNEKDTALHHVVRMPGAEIMNRYWDENDTARPESFREDVELVHQSGKEQKMLFRNLRAGAESGWDFSSRWFKDGNSFASIHTTEIVPVDLNCLMLHLEQVISESYGLKDDNKISKKYQLLAEQRINAIQKYCWNKEHQFYFDYDAVSGKQKQSFTLAGVTPLFFKIATGEQAGQAAIILKEKFLKPGGVVTTLENTGQQWDAPNGWAPLQWMTVKGLENYGFSDLAKEIAQRWIALNEKVYSQTGKMMEKYDVMNIDRLAGGGEYPGQDGFGWTNGVLLALIKKYGRPR
jgi:alpha,alpha-trehalase